MKYMLLIYTSEADSANMTEAAVQAEMAEYYAFNQTAAQHTTLIVGEALHPINTATTVRVRDGKTVTTDGPFAETKEQLGGFYLLDCKDLDHAIEMAAMIPGARHGSIEIRPIVVFG